MDEHVCTIDIEFEGDGYFDVEFLSNEDFEIDVGVVTEIITDSSGLPVYRGDYDITPKVYASQVLATENHRMSRDVIVQRIPQYEVSNNEGGVTLIIGDEYYG